MKTFLLIIGFLAVGLLVWQFAKALWSKPRDIPSAENDWRSDKKQPGSPYESGQGNYGDTLGSGG